MRPFLCFTLKSILNCNKATFNFAAFEHFKTFVDILERNCGEKRIKFINFISKFIPTAVGAG